MQYRHEPVNRRLRKMGKRESMLHTDALQLIYARICHGCILEIGPLRGGSTVPPGECPVYRSLHYTERNGAFMHSPLAPSK